MAAVIQQPATGADARRAIRARHFRGPTAGLAPGYVQANVAFLPQAHAVEFVAYCQANPAPCPLLAVNGPGVTDVPSLGADLDVRTDLPAYLVFENGVAVAELDDITSLWRRDLVTVISGCSFSFDHILASHGIPVGHLIRRSNVAMWRTTIQTTTVGRFGGGMVVSMRAIRKSEVARAVQLTAGLPAVHGAPIHWGDPAAIGISDIAHPDYGDPQPVAPEDVPVFWPCGVTAQVALQRAALPFAITHKPGCMLVTDRLVESLR